MNIVSLLSRSHFRVLTSCVCDFNLYQFCIKMRPFSKKNDLETPRCTKRSFKPPRLIDSNIKNAKEIQNKSERAKITYSSKTMNEPHVKEAFLQFRKNSRTLTDTSSVVSSVDQSQSKLDQTLEYLDQITTNFDLHCDFLMEKELCNETEDSLHLSQEVLNRSDVKEKFLKHCNEKFAKEMERISQEINSDLLFVDSIYKKTTTKKPNPDQGKNNKNNKENVVKGSFQTQNKKIDNIFKEKSKKIEEDTATVTKLRFIQKMNLIHESRDVGLYVYCDSCDKARYLPDVKDPLELPEKWYCAMNADQKHNKCSDLEEEIEDKEYLIENLYNSGSIVWAKIDGYPWWPAMVEDDPGLEEYFWLEDSIIPVYYHVTLFDSSPAITRRWIPPSHLKAFKKNPETKKLNVNKHKRYQSRIDVAKQQATDALSLPLLQRLMTYSFIYRCGKDLGDEKQDTRNKKSKTITKRNYSIYSVNDSDDDLIIDITN